MTVRIAFLALTQAHQFLHWLPAALRLAHEPDWEVTVLSGSKEALEYIRGFDPEARLKLRLLWTPFRRKSLLDPPPRALVALLHWRTIASYPLLVTTETTSAFLYRLPGFTSRIIHIKHGAGDTETGFAEAHAHYDLTLCLGQKHKERLIARGLATEDDCIVVGYAKFELIRPPAKLFDDDKPVALYNPHWKHLSTFPTHGEALIREMESLEEWNFIVAPHIKLQSRQDIASRSSNIMIDRGSIRSIDMTYTQTADVYIGDVSSQVYEFIRQPRPCIFLNFSKIDWRDDENYLHWTLGQVIETVQELGPALKRCFALQPEFEPLQRQAFAFSIDASPVPASERQADTIRAFQRGDIAGRHRSAPEERSRGLLALLSHFLSKRLRGHRVAKKAQATTRPLR